MRYQHSNPRGDLDQEKRESFRQRAWNELTSVSNDNVRMDADAHYSRMSGGRVGEMPEDS